MKFTRGQKVRVTAGYYHSIERDSVVEYGAICANSTAYSWVGIDGREAIVMTADLSAADPITTAEDERVYAAIERVLGTGESVLGIAVLRTEYDAAISAAIEAEVRGD